MSADEETFWARLIENRNDRDSPVVKGIHYTICRESSFIPRGARGFGGDRYHIKFHDGRLVTSTNLWCQGKIPEPFRERLPDNARFLIKQEYERVCEGGKAPDYALREDDQIVTYETWTLLEESSLYHADCATEEWQQSFPLYSDDLVLYAKSELVCKGCGREIAERTTTR